MKLCHIADTDHSIETVTLNLDDGVEEVEVLRAFLSALGWDGPFDGAGDDWEHGATGGDV
jgi:hypothetical protein